MLACCTTNNELRTTSYELRLRGWLQRHGLECLLEDGVGRRCGCAELHVRYVDGDVRREAFLVNGCVFRAEKARGREPQAAAVGQLDEFLQRRASSGVLPDERRTAVAVERRREHLRRAGGARVDEQR